LGKPASSTTDSETYKPKGWQGCTLKLSKQGFGKEDPEDSAAVKLEDVVYHEIDLSEDRVTGIAFGLLQGYPEVDVEGTKKNGNRFRYRVCRTKALNYVMSLSGATLPADDVVKQLFESLKLSKEPPAGNWSKWLPSPAVGKFLAGSLEAWAPSPFKASDDFPDFGETDIKGEAHESAFGYCSYTVAVVNLPPGMEEKLDDDGLDKLIHEECDEDEDGNKATYSEFKTNTVDKIQFRSTTFANDTVEGRVDCCVMLNKLYMFSVSVPRGMLESESVKRFYSSIKIH
jgi:hypothetical protein